MSTLYNKLEERSIRLLDLMPGELNSPLQGRLHPASLDPPGTYEALSYTWGAPETAGFMKCENGSIPLTLNLVQALLRLRLTNTIRILWIDQICINQNDNIERGQQVSLMGEIYRGASVVNIWLGEEDENTWEGMQYIPHLLKAFTHPNERDGTGHEVPHVLEALGLLTVKSPRWLALRALFERPYFRRMWIVQEVALGKKCVVYCGSCSVSWQDLSKAALCLEDDAEHQIEAHRVVRMIMTLRRNNVAGGRIGGYRPLTELIHQSFNLLCTNPRDKIYGVLGLASDINPEHFSPNYSLSCQDVYIETTVACIKKDGCLDIICQVRLPKLLQGLPSWVPDWTVISAPRESLASKFSESYSAYGREPSPLTMNSSRDNCTLYAKGKFVDKIKEVCSVMLNPDHDSTGQSQILSEWKKYARKVSPYITGETYPTIFWRTLIADGGTRGEKSDHTRQQLYEAHKNLVERNTGIYDDGPQQVPWEPIAELSIVNTRSLEFERLMSSACVGRKIAITENGSLGLVPSEAQIGDEIVVLETVKVPLVFRRVPLSKDRALIGECYLQGWMDGARFDSLSGADIQLSIV